jgi:hypothetical protein
MVVRVLETSFSGSLITAGMGHLPYGEIPEFLVAAARLMVASTAAGDPEPRP